MSEIDYLQNFPALNTVSNKLEAKYIKQFNTSNINQTFTISVLDKKFDNGQVINVANAKSICKKIMNETGVSVEIGTTKTKADMTFIVSGNKANVDAAKKRIVSSFKTQITGALPNLEEAVQAIKALMEEFDSMHLRAREKTFIGEHTF